MMIPDYFEIYNNIDDTKKSRNGNQKSILVSKNNTF